MTYTTADAQEVSEEGRLAMARLPRPARADQLRNRRQILEAAREMFARQPSDDVSFDDIAEAAGVGRATLFRHIGSKDALVNEIYRSRTTDLLQLATDALGVAEPWAGVELMVQSVARWLHEDRGLYPYIVQQARLLDGPADVIEAVSGLDAVLVRAWADGSLWVSIATRELVPLMAYTAEPSIERQELYTRMLLRSLRA